MLGAGIEMVVVAPVVVPPETLIALTLSTPVKSEIPPADPVDPEEKVQV